MKAQNIVFHGERFVTMKPQQEAIIGLIEKSGLGE